MSEAGTLVTLRALLVAVSGFDADKITPEAKLDDLGLDSLDTRDLEMALEDRLDITVPLDAFDRAETVGDIVAAVDKIRARVKA